jgi:septal ring factor EnvC (AmiA/AmiB activator)
MDDLWDKLGAIIAALITAFGGFYMYDRKTTNERLTKVELDVAQSKSDIRVIETKFTELKEDTKEIKESQKAIIELLTKRRGNK